MLRAVKNHCDRLGFPPPPRTLHSFRHTFAVNYLRRGGSVFHLQKVLGHSTLEMTRRYANLVTADLQAVHERVSSAPTVASDCSPSGRLGILARHSAYQHLPTTVWNFGALYHNASIFKVRDTC